MNKLLSKATFMKMSKEELIDEIYSYHNNCVNLEKSHSQVVEILQRATKECPAFDEWYVNSYMPTRYTKQQVVTSYIKDNKE